MTLLFFLVPVIIWLLFAKFWLKHDFSLKELGVQAVLSIIVLAGLFWASDRIQTGSTKIVNGEVTQLRPVKKSCPVGWVTYTDDHCTDYISRNVKVNEVCSTDNKGNKSCTDITETQYNYTYPWERRYFVDTDIDHVFEIKRVDGQGVFTPPRFSSIQISDPVSREIFYKNYIRAAVNTLFKAGEAEIVETRYPRVFDYYNLNRVIYDGVTTTPADMNEWNKSVAYMNRDLRGIGANVIIVVTDKPEAYADGLAFTWGGHNINDVVVTIGMADNENNISWVDVRSWSAQSLVNVQIKDAITKIGMVDHDRINEAIMTAVNAGYTLQDMEAFSYLKDDISLPVTTIILALMMILVFTPLITFYFSRHVDWR